MKYIAIDLGTSFIKGALVDPTSMQIDAIVRRPTPPRIAERPADVVELDPLLILDRTSELIVELHTHQPDVRGILLCGQMGGLILCDTENQPVTPYISWLDRRADRSTQTQASVFQNVRERIGNRAASVLGNELRSGLVLSLLEALKQSGDLKLASELIPMTLPDFIAARLGNGTAVTEFTNAAGAISIESRSYPTDVFHDLDVQMLNWPSLVDYRHRIGEFVAAPSSRIPVYAATGDHQTSLVGTMLRPDELSINISTGSQISMIASTAAPGDFQLRPFFDGTWLKTITSIPAGRALTAVMNLLTELRGGQPTPEDWDAFLAAASTIDESSVDVSLALFPGAFEPPGHFSRLDEQNLNVAQLARGCLEQMARQYQSLAERLGIGSARRIAFSGGLASRSELLRNLIERRLNLPFRLAPSGEDALMGLCVLGRVISGLDQSISEAIVSAETVLNR